ncbi:MULTISPECIES: carbohydrate ABC transporter permease [unclassified Plantibacter]|uniref:carbohydrate ABC transporter permease n=1 Tax=unclassified Plantibacter TaxID=2624265 RepID=UPI0008DE94E7|nr:MULTISPECIES: carbohydrate ABC transporter permease [unclassified Plantibacter]MBF4564001.1 carbohydrate ABC transporter permease [Plantibacter sp. VKM Ac-2876]OII39256.1 ABC transporter permease [Plantibacter sp. MMLR14_011]
MSTPLSNRIRTRMDRIEAPKPKRKRPSTTAWIILAGLALLAILILGPFFLTLLNAFKSQSDYSSNGPLSWPSSFEIDGLIRYVTTVNFGQKLVNSLIISSCVALGTVALSLISAYAIGVGRVRGRVAILAILLIANILPQEALIYPLFAGVQAVNGSNSLLPIIVILTVLHSSFGIYLLASVLGTFPRALIEAAEVDGASRWRVLWQVVVPVIRPTLGVLFIFVFIWSWNEFFIPILFLTSADTQTIPIALASLQGERFLNPTMTAAGSLLSLIPTLILFLVFQRSLVRGVTVGSIK